MNDISKDDKMTNTDTTPPVDVERLRMLALTGYIGLLVLMPAWLVWLHPPKDGIFNFSLVLFWLPLFFPMRGLIKGTPYTYAWANFVVMLNYMHGFTSLWVSDGETIYAVLELIFATLMFLPGIYYARFKGRELGLKLPKLKDQK